MANSGQMMTVLPHYFASGEAPAVHFGSGDLMPGGLGSGTLLSGWSPVYPATIVSGGQGSLPHGSHFASGATVSGYAPYVEWQTYCVGCGKRIGWDVDHVKFHIVSNSGSNLHRCFDCAGYRPDLGRLERREDWIKETVPLRPDTPDYMLADWLEEQGRQKDADYMRELAQKAQRSG